MVTTMGEALIDIIVDAHGDVDSVVGGAALNTARTIARLGVPVEYLGGLSSDGLGDRIRRSISADGITLAIREPVDVPTTLAIAQINEDGSASYRFLIEGTSVASVDPQRAVAAVSPDSTFLHVGGIALAVEPSASAAVGVVRESPPDRLVLLDPNFRPAIAATSPVLREAFDALLPRADVLKASTEDLGYLFPGRPPLDVARMLNEQFGLVVLVTAGGDDSWIVSADGMVRCPVPRVDVVDTVGAGDSFSGGFAAWWVINGLGRRELSDTSAVTAAVAAGMAVAALSCSRIGADPPRLSELSPDWSRRSSPPAPTY